MHLRRTCSGYGFPPANNAPKASTTCAPFSEGRYGYPRPRCNEHHIDEDTKRWVYRCEKKEDERLSPYIAVWLLATGEP